MKEKKINIYKFVSIITMLLIFLIPNIATASSQADVYDWEELKRRYENFLEYQSEENKRALFNFLPTERLKYEQKNHEVIYFIYRNLSPLEELAQSGDIMALRILFRIKLFFDGGASEELSIIIGSTITSNPENFLIVLEENLDIYSGTISHLLGNLGPDYVDEFKKEADALLERYLAINSVEVNNINNILPTTKHLCLYYLSSFIASSHKMWFYVEGKEELLDKYR